jgi:hypothetical protein
MYGSKAKKEKADVVMAMMFGKKTPMSKKAKPQVMKSYGKMSSKTKKM